MEKALELRGRPDAVQVQEYIASTYDIWMVEASTLLEAPPVNGGPLAPSKPLASICPLDVALVVQKFENSKVPFGRALFCKACSEARYFKISQLGSRTAQSC